MDGRYLISNGKDQTTKLWDMRKMKSPSDDAVKPNNRILSYTDRTGWYVSCTLCVVR